MTESVSRPPRGSRDLWLEAAHDLLITGGIDAVKVMPMARHLNLTRTGFYWFFKDVADLHEAMIRRWEDRNTGHLVARCNTGAGSICAGLFDLMDCWFDPALFDARLDLAIRNWARLDPDLQHRLDRVDAQRIAAVAEMFRRFGYSAEQAETRSMTVIYTQIGYISMQVRETPAARLARVPHYVEVFAGVTPAPQEVDAFLARHQCVV